MSFIEDTIINDGFCQVSTCFYFSDTCPLLRTLLLMTVSVKFLLVFTSVTRVLYSKKIIGTYALVSF